MPEYANVWPRGGLFAFSGVDGETCHAEPFVASGTPDGIGWSFWLTPRLTFTADIGETPVVALGEDDDYCFTDCWRCAVSAGSASGHVKGAFLDRRSMSLEIALEDGAAPDAVRLVPDREGQEHGDAAVFEAEGCWVALHAVTHDAGKRFSLAISYQSGEDAATKAVEASAVDLDAAIAARLSFYESFQPPGALEGAPLRAFYKAASVMKANTESAQKDIPCRWTTPDRMPHRHMWLWDSAFHALGLSHLDPELAEDAIRALLSKQRDDGKLLLAVQPGVPEREEDNTQPPVVAWAAWRQYEITDRRPFLEEAYPSLVRYIEWFEANRKRPNGLYGWQIRVDADPVSGARGGESGMDNSPRFDTVRELTAVDLSSYMAAEYRALERMARELERDGEARQWRDRRVAIAERVNELLWDDEDQFYYDLNEDGALIAVKTAAGFMPLHGGIPDRDRAEGLRTHLLDEHAFWTCVPVPSVAVDEPSFSKDMWRGPAWMNLDVLIFDALKTYSFLEEACLLAREAVTGMTQHYMQTGCLYEYYDALGEVAPPELPRKGAPGTQGGTGFGVIADYNWTAAALIHLTQRAS
jgi:Mannosylglycerate hydrolase MGH1-like glycoside hydrolase domain